MKNEKKKTLISISNFKYLYVGVSSFLNNALFVVVYLHSFSTVNTILNLFSLSLLSIFTINKISFHT